MKFILRLMLFIPLLIQVGNTYGQDVYMRYNYNIYELDLMSCDTTLISRPTVHIGAMTFAPDGNLYGYGFETHNLYLIDQETGECTLIAILPSGILYADEIVANDQGVIFFFFDLTVASYDLITGAVNIYTDFSYRGWGATYANGKIYFTTPEEGIFELDQENPVNSTLVYPFAFDWDHFYLSDGLASLPVTCDSSALYAIYTIETNDSEIHEINLSTQSYTLVCTLDLQSGVFFSPLEYSPPPCELFIDLDEDDDTAMGFNYVADTSCVTSGLEIHDMDLLLSSEAGFIDSAFVFFAPDAVLNAAEYFSTTVTGNVSITGDNTTFVTIQDMGNAEVSDFDAAIRGIQYHNDMTPFEAGFRRIGVVLWSQGNVSDTAWATIPFFDFTLDAGENVSIEVCSDEAVFSLFDILEGTPEAGGVWYPQTTANNGLFNPNVDGAGDYLYIQAGYRDCPSDTAIVSVTVEASSSFSLGNDTILCSGQSLILAPDVTGQSYLWQDGSEAQNYEVSLSGLYWVEVENNQGCISSDSIYITFEENSETSEEITLCAGDSFEYEGEIYEEDAVIVGSFTNQTGCDSIHHINLSFMEPIEMIINKNICEGESFNFEGMTLYRDTSICRTNTSLLGCDSIYCLNLNVSAKPIINLGMDTTINFGSSLVLDAGIHELYQWSDGSMNALLTVHQAGSYSVTVTDENCNSEDEITIRLKAKNDLFAPNVFTPNNDGINDQFTIFAKIGTATIEELNIFNRWGSLVFRKEDFPAGISSIGWNGYYKNQPAPSDVYVFFANILWADGQKERISGEVTLLR